MAKDSFWFKHDQHARNDIKIVGIRRRFGMEGYGVYFALIEMMRSTDGYIISLDEVPDIAYELRVEEKVIAWIIKDSGLFILCVGGYCSERLKSDMKKLDSIKQQRSEAGRKGGLKSRKPQTKAKGKHRLTIAKAKGKQIKASRVDKIRRDKSIKDNNNEKITFKKWFELYDLKQDEIKCETEWARLTSEDKIAIEKHLPEYIEVTEKKFRVNPYAYLKNRRFMNEIIDRRKQSEIPADPDRPYNPHS